MKRNGARHNRQDKKPLYHFSSQSDGGPAHSLHSAQPQLDEQLSYPSDDEQTSFLSDDESAARQSSMNDSDTVLPLPNETEDLADSDAFQNMKAFKTFEAKQRKARKKKTIKIIIAVIAVLLLLCGGVAWYVISQAQKALDNIKTETYTVEKGIFSNTIKLASTLEPGSSIGVTPDIEGIIDQVYVVEGSSVNAGDLLFTLKNDELDTLVAQADEQVSSANNSLRLAKLTLEEARHAYSTGEKAAATAAANEAAARAAAEAKGLPYVPSDTVVAFDASAAQSVIDQAKISLDNAYLALESAQAAYDKAVATAEKRNVTAPCAGSVTAVNAKSGIALSSMMSAGSAVQISDLSSMKLTIQVNEIDVLDVTPGQACTVTFSAIPDLTAQGEVTRVAAASTSSGGSAASLTGNSSGGVVTYAVDIVIPEPDSRLKPGMSASASITTKELKDVLMVPFSAVQIDANGGRYVVLITDLQTGATEDRAVTLVCKNSATAVIEGNIKEGDTLSSISMNDAITAVASSTSKG